MVGSVYKVVFKVGYGCEGGVVMCEIVVILFEGLCGVKFVLKLGWMLMIC